MQESAVGGQFWETDLDAELNMIELNCVGLAHLAKHVAGHMMGQNRGRILITSSIAGEMVAPREAVYAATKAFGLSFAHSLRLRAAGYADHRHGAAARPDRHGRSSTGRGWTTPK
jgi:short-subunit dehydrogenase